MNIFVIYYYILSLEMEIPQQLMRLSVIRRPTTVASLHPYQCHLMVKHHLGFQ